MNNWWLLSILLDGRSSWRIWEPALDFGEKLTVAFSPFFFPRSSDWGSHPSASAFRASTSLLKSNRMVLDALSSPHRRAQNVLSLSSQSKKQMLGLTELGSWSTLFERHRFLLTMLALLAFLCTIYLYFAITLGTAGTCSALSGAEKALCEAKSVPKGKLKFF